MENACFNKVFLSSDFKRVSVLVLLLSRLLKLLQNEIWSWSFTWGGSESSSLQPHLPYSITLNGLSSPKSGLDLSLQRLKAFLLLRLWLNNLKHLITFNFKIENEACASLQPWMHALTWLAGWRGEMLLHYLHLEKGPSPQCLRWGNCCRMVANS